MENQMTDLTPNDLSYLSDEEFNALCPQGYHATGDEPEPPEPTDQELLELMPQPMRDDLAAAARAMAQQAGTAAGIFRTVLNTHALTYARAVLAQHGRH
jgi:hypothetical protein